MFKRGLLYLFCIASALFVNAQNYNTIALLKYGGGGDWYANPTSLKNLITFCNPKITQQWRWEVVNCFFILLFI